MARSNDRVFRSPPAATLLSFLPSLKMIVETRARDRSAFAQYRSAMMMSWAVKVIPPLYVAVLTRVKWVSNRYATRMHAGKLPHMSKILVDRINSQLEKLKLTPRAASLLVGTNPDLIRGILRAGENANPTSETMSKIASALETTPAWLAGEDIDSSPNMGRPESRRTQLSPTAEAMPRDLPVWGTAAGSVIDDKIEGFHLFTGEPIDYVRRPPALARVKDAYAIYVTGDSMEPMHNAGDLRFVHPHRPATAGDTVVVQTHHWEHDPGQGYIKIYRRKKGSAILLEQLNPNATLEVPLQFVSTVHRVLTMNDLFGV